MNSLRDGWKRESTRMKTVYIIGAVVLLVIIIASVVGWLFWPKGSSITTVADAPVAVGEAETEQPSESAETPDTVTMGAYTFEVDENGMVVMPVTSDPVEAAAGAAAVAWNVDTTKVNRQEFFDTAIERMTRPSPEYVGPDGEIHTLFSNIAFEDPIRERGEPAEYMHDEVRACGLVDLKVTPCVWWELANHTTFENQQRMEAVWTGVPALVMNEDEMTEWNKATLGYRVMEDVDLEPDTPGATLTRLFVMSDVEQFFGAGASDMNTNQTQFGAAFRIWCDAPADGGICGVASFGRPGAMPTVWPR